MKKGGSLKKKKDLVVIGGGPGGYVAAIRAAQLGLNVTCIEKRGKLGGTCLNVGCIPTKALLHSSEVFYEATHDAKKLGLKFGESTFDYGRMHKFKDTVVSGLTGGIEQLFKKNGVEYIKGSGQIAGRNEVRVFKTGSTDRPEILKAKSILIATGSVISKLPNIKVDGEYIIDSDDFFRITKVPKKVVIIGAGVIGLEIGSIYARLGANVEYLEYLPRIAPGTDSEVAALLQKSLEKKLKMKFHLSQKVTGAKVVEEDGKKQVMLEVAPAQGDGPVKMMKADVALVAVGRSAYTDNLGLEVVGIPKDTRGKLDVNEKYQTEIENIYAVGDVISKGPMLAHKAEEEGIIAAHVASGDCPAKVKYDTIPSVIYTAPEVASVGLTEEELAEKGIEYDVGSFPLQANGRARSMNATEGFIKVLTSKENMKILGVHMISHSASDLIATASLATYHDMDSVELGEACYAHPTLSEALKEASMDTFGLSIHK